MHSLTNAFEYVSLENRRGVAQLGSALGSGPRGREFKSPLPDQFILKIQWVTEAGSLTVTETVTVLD